MSTRSGPLCWAQHWYWLINTPQVRKDGPASMFVETFDVPPGLPATVFRAALAELVARHEALRTVYRLDEHGAPVQVVCPPAETPLTVVEVPAGEPAEAVARRLADHVPHALDVAVEPPIRAVAGVTDGRVRSVLFAVHWLAVDGASLAVLRAELEEIIGVLATGGQPDLAAPAWQPVDQGLAQQVDSVRRANDEALRHWRETLAVAPHATLPFYWRGRPGVSSLETVLVSRELAEGCRAAAARHRVSPPTLMMSLLVTLLVSWTGQRACSVGSAVANRWSPELRRSVGRYASVVQVFVDLEGADPTFSDVARQVGRAQVAAYRNGVYDSGEYMMTVARESSRIGARPADAVFFEYHDYAAGVARSGEPDDASDDPWLRQTPDPEKTQNLQIDVVPGEVSMKIAMRAPTSLLPAAAAQDFLYQLSALVRAVRDEPECRLSTLANLVDLPAHWRGPGWCSVRGAWINLADITELLAAYDGVASALVIPVERAGADPDLVAYVAPEAAGQVPSPADLDEYLREEATHYPSVMVPHRYVVCRSAPDDVTDPAQWLAQPVLATSAMGVGGPSVPVGDSAAMPVGPQQEALAAAFRACHPGRLVRMSASYAELHGEFLRIPAMLEHLDRAGYQGLEFSDFFGMATLRRLATKLR
ncbi:condensation domain-containing protein [Micromonosporaceae bacterium B7E4]